MNKQSSLDNFEVPVGAWKVITFTGFFQLNQSKVYESHRNVALY